MNTTEIIEAIEKLSPDEVKEVAAGLDRKALAHGYAYQEGLLSEDDCETMAAIADHLISHHGKRGTVGTDTGVDESIRWSGVYFCDPYNVPSDLAHSAPLIQSVYMRMLGLAHIVQATTLNGSVLPLDPKPRELPQYTRYQAGEFYDWHTDSSVNSDRHLSMSLTIGRHSGGELQFENVALPDHVKEAINKPGTAIVFPSWARHRVTKVKGGLSSRHSIVQWFSRTQGD